MNSTKRNTNPALTKSRRNFFLCAFLVMIISFLAFSPSAFAAIEHDGGASSAADWCAVTNTKDHTRNDYSTCLPAGRWGSLVGTIQIRTEPYDGNIIGQAGNMLNNMAKTSMQIIPGAFMAITQICWSGTIALSQFAATFDPLDVAGARVDHAVAQLVNGSDGRPGLMQGSIPAALVVLAILSLAVAAGFEIGTVKEASKRLLATVLCLAAIITMGAGAAKTGTTASEPATGSPWWVVRTINTTINKLTVNLNLDGLTNNSAMMAYDNGSISNCQDYLMAMHKQYDTNPNSGNSTSSITKAVNLLWEETALRSWVTMQYGNPQAGGNTSSKVAANAQQAYCHVLEMKANTNPEVQTSLTNQELGLSGENIINNKTGSWIFDENGWISTLHSMVDDSDSTDDRDDTIMQDRAAIFWETCTAESGKIKAREGWKQLIKNLGDHPTYAIKNGKRVLRVANNTTDSKAISLQRTRPSEDSTLMSENIDQLCSAVLLHEGGIFQHSNDGPVAEVSEPKKSENGFVDTNLGDAATLGWRFDVPNVGGTWSEANLGNLSDSRSDIGGMKQTIDYLYGNSTSDWLGAFGSVVGGICSLIVFGSLSLILIVAKLMLTIMGLFLIFALIIRAFPVGEKPKKILINWIKYTGNLGLTGMLYSALAVLATFICSITLDFCSGMASSFTYNVIAGISPVLALIMIGLFCSKVVKCGNPFSLKAMMNLAGGSALISGIGRGMNIADRFRRNNFYKSMRNRGGRHASTGQYSSKNAGGVGQAVESQKIVEGASEAMQAAGAPNPPKSVTSTTVAGAEKPTFAERWATRGDNSLRAELGQDGTATKAATLFSKAGLAGKNILHPNDDQVSKYAEKYLLKNPSISREKLAKKVAHRQGLHNIATRAAGIGKALGYGAAGGAMLAAGVVRSRTGRDLISRGAKLAVTGGLAAAAFTNPFTAPLGLLAMGKLAASRDTWKLSGYVAKTTGKAAGRALGATGRTLGAAGHFVGTQIGNGVSYLQGRIDQSHSLFLDSENTAPIDNPFISEQFDPQTDEKLYTTDDQGHQTLTDFGQSLQTQILRQKQDELAKQGLDPDEINEKMYHYQMSGQLADDLYESAQRLTDFENGNTDPYYQEPLVDDQTGEFLGTSTDRMYQPDGETFTANGQRAVNEARDAWIRDYALEHPGVGYDQAAAYLDKNPDVYMDQARQIFNEKYGYSGQGAPFVPPAPEESHNGGTIGGTSNTTVPVASTAPALSTVLPPTPNGTQPSTSTVETTTPLNPVTPTSSTPSQDDVYTRTIVDQNGVPQARMIDPLWNKTGTAMTEQGQVAYDAAEQAFRQQQQAQGLSDEAIEQKLDQADVQRNIMEQARKIYDQQNSQTQRIPLEETQQSQTQRIPTIPQPAQPQTATQSRPVVQQSPVTQSPVTQSQPVIQPHPVAQSQPVAQPAQQQPSTQPLPPVTPAQQTPRVAQSSTPMKPANPIVPPAASTPQTPRGVQPSRTPLNPQPIPAQQPPVPQQPGSPHNPPVTPPTTPASPTVAALNPHPLPNNKNTKGQ